MSLEVWGELAGFLNFVRVIHMKVSFVEWLLALKLLKTKAQLSKPEEWAGISRSKLSYKACPYWELGRAVQNNTSHKKGNQVTKYHSCYHMVNLSKLLDLHNKVFLSMWTKGLHIMPLLKHWDRPFSPNHPYLGKCLRILDRGEVYFCHVEILTRQPSDRELAIFLFRRRMCLSFDVLKSSNINRPHLRIPSQCIVSMRPRQRMLLYTQWHFDV